MSLFSFASNFSDFLNSTTAYNFYLAGKFLLKCIKWSRHLENLHFQGTNVFCIQLLEVKLYQSLRNTWYVSKHIWAAHHIFSRKTYILHESFHTLIDEKTLFFFIFKRSSNKKRFTKKNKFWQKLGLIFISLQLSKLIVSSAHHLVRLKTGIGTVVGIMPSY